MGVSVSFPRPNWTRDRTRQPLGRGWGTSHPTLVCCHESAVPVHMGGTGDSRSHSCFFLTTGMGTTWKILALWSSVSRVTQVGRKLPLKPTNAILSAKQ